MDNYKYLVILPPSGQETGWRTVISPADSFEVEVRNDEDEVVESENLDTPEQVLEVVKTYLEKFEKENV